MYCTKCGAQVNEESRFCHKCGFSLPNKNYQSGNYNQWQTQSQAQQPTKSHEQDVSQRNGIAFLLLALFVGCLGIHSFYAGKIGIGVLQIITLGGLGIWVLIDIILVATGSYYDADGKRIVL